MFKYLLSLVIIAFWWQQIQGEISIQNGTKSEIPPLPNNLTQGNNGETPEELNKKSVVGHNNHGSQQAVYLYRNQLPQLWDYNKGLGRWPILPILPILPAGYLFTPGMGAHKLHPRKVTWNEARRACIDEGGHLAIINSESEEKILLRVMQEQKVQEAAYLGVHDIFQEGEWVTVLDEALESTGYTRWTTKYPNVPDNTGGKQNCGVLVLEGGMDDITCTHLYPFFCEISL